MKISMDKQIIQDSVRDIKYLESKGDKNRAEICRNGLKIYKEIRRKLKMNK
jgi:hypothetical protein